MVARFHYNDTVYQQLLLDKLPENEQAEVTAHVETCKDCQSKLDSLSQVEVSWDDVRQYLNPDEFANGSTGSTIGFDESRTRATLEPVGFLAEAQSDDSIGQFGRYEIKELLGRGGMGVVMRGYDPALNRHSAIKVLAPELATHSAARKRFSREAKSAAAVVHEHVVPIQTVDEEQGLPYLVMPVVEGRSLEERVTQQGPLELKEVLRIGMQIASGLAAAHAQGLVHRDVKPANILLENGVERVMITDFGLARAADDASMTRSGVIAGTPQYMSPEQSRGADIDARSDLFSLGSVLYFMCCGHSPFRAETTMGVLHRIVNDEPRSIRAINPDVPLWLEAIINRLLSKDANGRYQSAQEVSDILENWLAHLQQPDKVAPPEKLPLTPTSSSWSVRTWLACAVGFAFFAVATIVIILEWNKGTLTINAPREVPIRIMKNNEIVQRMTIRPGGGKTRIAAGDYIVEIEGEHDGLMIENGKVTLSRGDSLVVSIVETPRPRIATQPGDVPPTVRSSELAVGQSLLDAVREFNERASANKPDYPQPPLTDEEVVASIRWSLRKSNNGRLDEHRRGLTMIAEQRVLPKGWTLTGGDGTFVADNLTYLRVWDITVSNSSERNDIHTIRRRYNARLFAKDTKQPTEDTQGEGDPLAKAIEHFNDLCRDRDLGTHPPLTEDEVIAAILGWNARREEAPVSDEDFEVFQSIATTRRLPKNCTIDLRNHIRPDDRELYRVWSIRLRMNAHDASKSFAFPLRERFISFTEVKESDIHWGPPATNGLQAGVRLSPPSSSLTFRQPVLLEFVFRHSGKELMGRNPNIYSYDAIKVFDSAGNPIRVVHHRGNSATVKVGRATKWWHGGELNIRPASDNADFERESNMEVQTFSSPKAIIYAEPGQSCRMRFVVSDPTDVAVEKMKTGEVAFKVTETSSAHQYEHARNSIDESVAPAPKPESYPPSPYPRSNPPMVCKLCVVDDETGERLQGYSVAAGAVRNDGKFGWSTGTIWINKREGHDEYDELTFARDASKAPDYLRVTANGYVPHRVNESPVRDWSSHVIEVRLRRGKSVSGRVVYLGMPVSSARVFMLRESHRNQHAAVAESPNIKGVAELIPFVTYADTNDDGEFTLTGWDSEVEWLAVLAKGRTLTFVRLDPAALDPNEVMELDLPRPATLKIIAPAPNKDQYVSIRYATGGGLKHASSELTSDVPASGECVFTGLAFGKYNISLMKRSGARYVRLGLREVVVEAG